MNTTFGKIIRDHFGTDLSERKTVTMVIPERIHTEIFSESILAKLGNFDQSKMPKWFFIFSIEKGSLHIYPPDLSEEDEEDILEVLKNPTNASFRIRDTQTQHILKEY